MCRSLALRHNRTQWRNQVPLAEGGIHLRPGLIVAIALAMRGRACHKYHRIGTLARQAAHLCMPLHVTPLCSRAAHYLCHLPSDCAWGRTVRYVFHSSMHYTKAETLGTAQDEVSTLTQHFP